MTAGATHQSAGMLARVFAWILTLWAGAASAPAYTVDAFSESAVRAAFLLRFAGFVEWPAASLDADRFTIAVLGDAALAADLQQLADDRVLGGRAVEVRRVTTVSRAQDAQVLFVGASRRGELRSLLRGLAGFPVLVVTAEEGALDAGSVINFRREGGRVRFEVSVPAAQRMGLRISSELLSVAQRVEQ